MRQQPDRHLGHDRDARRLQEVGDLEADEGGAHDHVAIGVDHEPRGPWRLPAEEARACGIGGGHVHGARRDPGVHGLLQREADGRDLRIGERHPRRGGRVDAHPRRLAEDVVGGHPALVLAHVREQRPAVDVPDRVEPVDPSGAQVLVHLDWSLSRQPHRLQPQSLGQRLAADRHQHDLACDLDTRLQLQHGLRPLATRAAHRLAKADRDA